jgi:hypothetical protein
MLRLIKEGMLSRMESKFKSGTFSRREKLSQPEIGAYADIARRLGQSQLRRGSLLTLE